VAITSAVKHEFRGRLGLQALAQTLGAVDVTLAWNAPVVHVEGRSGPELAAMLRALVAEARRRARE
jgi:hypothetical protein